MSRRWMWAVTGPVLAGLVAVGLPACSATRRAVTVLGPWTGREEERFLAVLAAFEEDEGIEVDYQGTRAVTQVLDGDVENGRPPDVAVLPNPSAVVPYGAYLARLDDRILADLAPQWQELAGAVRPRESDAGAVYAVPVEVNLKSIVWHTRDPTLRSGTTVPVPDEPSAAELDQLTAAIAAGGTDPWCLGMASPATDGWPGTDWIEDILLHGSGAEVYAEWATGARAWTDAEVAGAWRRWGELAFGSLPPARDPARARLGALVTDFADAGRRLLDGGCVLEHQGSFALTTYLGGEGAPGPDDLWYFPFPNLRTGAEHEGRVWEVSADLAVMFGGTGEARLLMSWLAGEGQRHLPGDGRPLAELLVADGGGPDWEGFPKFSAHAEVGPERYHDEVLRRLSAAVAGRSGTLCFDASDLMPERMRSAFQEAVLEYLSDPGRLDALLEELEGVRRETVSEWLQGACGEPVGR